MIKGLTKLWPIATIAVCAFVLRTINLEELFYFTYDESVFAFVGRRFWLWQHIPLIGGVSPFGFHVAPYFYWFFGLILGFGNLNPVIWGYIGAFLGTLTTAILYFFAKEIDSRKTAFGASVLWATSYLANLYDRHFWGLTFGPLFSLAIIFCLYQIIKGKEKFVYVLGLLLALIIHADLSYYMFLLVVVVSWIVFKIPIKKSTFFAIGIIAASFMPLLIFDIRHDFANTKPILKFVQSGRNTPGFSPQKAADNALLFPRSFSRFALVQSDNEVSKQYSYCQAFVKEKLQKVHWYLVFFSTIILVGFVHYSLKKTRNVGWKLVALMLTLYFAGIQLYGTILKADIFEHYLSGIFALFILILAKLISILPRKLILVVLALFVGLNLYKLVNARNNLGLTVKRQAIEYTMQQVEDRPFSLDSISTCWKLNGYRYLFTIFGREPVKSYVDPNFSYLYGTTPVWENHPPTVVAFVTHDFVPETEEFYSRYDLLKSHEVTSNKFGALEVIIMDNSTSWFDSP